jgi:hypothetical protein
MVPEYQIHLRCEPRHAVPPRNSTRPCPSILRHWTPSAPFATILPPSLTLKANCKASCCGHTASAPRRTQKTPACCTCRPGVQQTLCPDRLDYCPYARRRHTGRPCYSGKSPDTAGATRNRMTSSCSATRFGSAGGHGRWHYVRGRSSAAAQVQGPQRPPQLVAVLGEAEWASQIFSPRLAHTRPSQGRQGRRHLVLLAHTFYSATRKCQTTAHIRKTSWPVVAPQTAATGPPHPLLNSIFGLFLRANFKL